MSGTIKRPARETGRIYVHVPERFKIDTVKAKATMVASTGKVLALDVEASSAPVPWQAAFRVVVSR